MKSDRIAMLERQVVRGLFLAILTSASAAQDLYDETVLRTLSITFSQPNWRSQLTQNFASQTYIEADLVVDGRTYRDVGVRYRGNSSYHAVRGLKKPFKIAMDRFVPGQELLGYSTLNLNNAYRDPSFVREVLVFRMFRRWMPASKANFVKLVVNGQNYGIYIKIEQSNKDLLGRWFEDTSGLRYRGERCCGGGADDPAFKWLGTSPALYARGYELKNENPSNPWTNLIETCRVLNQTPTAQLHDDVPKLLDVDNAIRYLAGNNLIPALDSYIGNTAHNFYLYEDPLHGRTAMLPWDHNATFGGNSWLSVTAKQQLDPFYFTTKTHRPLLSRVIVEPQWRQRYLAHMRAMMADFYNWTFVGPLAAKYQQLIDVEVQADPIRLYPYSQFKASVTTDLRVLIGSRYQWIPGIRPMIEKRRAYLMGRADFQAAAPALTQLTRRPLAPKDGDPIVVTVRAASSVGLQFVTLYWRRIGAFQRTPMRDDGRSGDGAAGDGVYGAILPRQNLGARIEYYVAARSTIARGGAMAFAPVTAGHRPPSFVIRELSNPGPLVINELLADNETVDHDSAGEYDDWLEVHNRGSTPIAIGGHHLSDDPRNPKLWAFPSGTTIPAGGFVRVWLDDQPTQGPLHATFKLDKDGETVYLSDATGRVLDLVRFGEQAADHSFGRLPDGGDRFFHLFAPSAGQSVTFGATPRPQPFDVRPNGSTRGFALRSTSVTRTGNLLNLQLFGGTSSATALLGLSLGQRTTGLGGLGSLLLDPAVLLVVPVPLDAYGFGGLSAPIPAGVHGVWLYGQAADRDLSNGLAVRLSR